jgi:hypothetical protein
MLNLLFNSVSTLRIHCVLLTSLVLNGSPFFFFPAQIMLDAGSPCATNFFLIVDLKAIYHSIMGMFLSWLSTQYPTQYPLSAALFHHSQALPLLRSRLAQGLHDNETYLAILCSMQTEVRLGFSFLSWMRFLTVSGTVG